MQKLRNVKKEDIIAAIQQYAEKLGRTPTMAEMAARFHIRKHHIHRHFGGYTHALRACGLERADAGRPVAMEALFRDWAAIVRKTGKIPSLSEYVLFSRYSYTPAITRFRKWIWVPQGMRTFAERQGLAGEFADVLAKVHDYCEQSGQGRNRRTVGMALEKPAEWIPAQTAGLVFAPLAHPSRATFGQAPLPPLMPDRPSYGAPMVPCPLALAPTNEMGVVLLFGALALQLGFVVLKIQQGYPDCEALRRMEGDRWQNVRIELEFESVNFLRHRHDAKKCDLIVCWVHNWRECPLEVVELSRLWQGGAGA